MSSKKHILLTGSTGFLGKHISKAFIEANYSVTPLHLKRNNNKKTATYDKREGIVVDSVGEIKEDLFDLRFDSIIHLATDYGNKEESEVKNCNFNLPTKLLDIASLKGIPFINADSFFSDLPDDYPYLKEYRFWKRSFRDYAKEKSKSENNTFLNMRIFHMFGPNDSPKKFIQQMLDLLLSEKDFIELTEGDQLRDFIYVDDVVRAFMFVEKEYFNTKQGYLNFDVASGKMVSVKYFLEKLKEKTGSSSNLRFGILNKREGEDLLSLIIPDIGPLESLGWRISRNLEESIDCLIKCSKIRG